MIRKIEIKDIESINDIYNQAVATKFQTCDTEPISLNERIEWFNNRNNDKYPIFVYEKNNKIIGWVSLSSYRKGRMALKFTSEISFYIHKEYQRQGIGSQLVEFAIQQAKELNFKNLFAILLERNIGSIKILEKFNFKKWGFLPNIADFNGGECGQFYYGIRITKKTPNISTERFCKK